MSNKKEYRVVVMTDEERAELLKTASRALENIEGLKCIAGTCDRPSVESIDAVGLGLSWFVEKELRGAAQKLSVTKRVGSNSAIYFTLRELKQVSLAGEMALSFYETLIFRQSNSPQCDDLSEYLLLSSVIDKVAEAIVYDR